MTMDAPQISTLRDDESPPPPPQQKLRVKLVLKDKPSEPPSAQTEDEAEEEDQEIDELIDDEPAKPTLNPIIVPPLKDVGSKKKVSTKRKQRKAEPKGKEKAPVHPPAAGPPLISWFNSNPSEHPDDTSNMIVDHPLDVKVSAKSKSTKKPSAPRAKKAPKQKATLPPVLVADDAGSESFAGTAASSPVTTHFDANTPEPDHPMAPALPLASEDLNLDLHPVPVYPLPTKPFPVQPAPKIPTGFAPVIPLERNAKHTKVRAWRVAQREIRGIAGGRWFARSWVGAKNSEYANALATAATLKGLESNEKLGSAVAIPKLSAVSISSPTASKTAKRSRPKASSSHATSAAPSRSGSVVPDVSTTVRAPTKMRTVLGPPSDAGDSDMTGPLDM